MKHLKEEIRRHTAQLLSRYGELTPITDQIAEAYRVMEKTYERGCKLLIAGNGGSAADAGHMAGELMKRFRIHRPLPKELQERLMQAGGDRGAALAQRLDMPLTALSLSAHEPLVTAIINDMGGEDIFAQQILGVGQKGDTLLAISTSGSSENILRAIVMARALDMKVIGLTGKDGGKMASLCDVTVRAPATETYQVQEYHLPIYHCWCLMLEERFFGKNP